MSSIAKKAEKNCEIQHQKDMEDHSSSCHEEEGHKHHSDEHSSCGCGHSHRAHKGHEHREHESCCHHDESHHAHEEEHSSCHHEGEHHEHGKEHSCCHHDHNSHSHSHHHHHSHGGKHSASCACGHTHAHSGAEHLKYKFAISVFFFVVALLCKWIYPNIKIFNISVFIPMFVASWFFAGIDVLMVPIKNFRRGIIFDENFLMSIATLGAFVLGEWAEAASVMLFYNLGEMAQDAIVEKARESITELVDINASMARVLKDKEEDANLLDESLYEIEEAEHVEIGSILLIKPGEMVALDAVVLEGSSELNTASMTGESLPRFVSVGNKVLSGFVNLTGLLVVKTVATLENTEAFRMLQLIEKAKEKKAKAEKLITSFAKVYTPIVLLAALLISILPPLFAHYFLNINIVGFESFAPWLNRGLTFLVISCPCAFILSVPLAYFAGIGSFAKNGILVKGADYIDSIAKVKKIVFDKTGTLTYGKLKIVKFVPSENITEKELLNWACIAESASNHPVAVAIKAWEQNKEDKDSNKVSEERIQKHIEEYTERAGKGVACRFDGKMLYAGRKSFIEEVLNINLPPSSDIGTHLYVAYDGSFLGYILLQDEIKKEAKDVILSLKEAGITEIEMLTGDAKENAEEVSKALGLTNYTPELLPSEKVECFEKSAKKFKDEHKGASIMFMGDGINDAATLSIADIGVAVGNLASDAAVQASDVVFMSDNLSLIPKSIELSKRTRRIVKENIFISFAIKLGFLLLGSLGIAGLQVAVLADVGVALLATLNSMRLKK